MDDRNLRILERTYARTQSDADLMRLNRARRRVGQPIFRTKIVHYVKTDDQHWITGNGAIMASSADYVHAPCWALLWPRSKTAPKLHYTSDKARITCKTCDRCVKGKNFEEGPPRLHLLRKLEDGTQRAFCGNRFGSTTEDREKAKCPGCIRIVDGHQRTRGGHGLNARGRRRLRRQAQFVFERGLV